MLVPHDTAAVGPCAIWPVEPVPGEGARSTTPFPPSTVEAESGFRRGREVCDLELLLDEAALIARVVRGDDNAACTLVAELRPTILKCIQKRLPRWASEEDLVQITLEKVLAHLDQFSGSVPLKHWVARIAINTALKQIRHESTRAELRMGDLSEEQQAAIEDLPGTESDSWPQQQARDMVDLLLARLDPDEKQIITLLHLEQHSVREISFQTGLSISMVKVKAFRTRRKMRDMARQLFTSGAATEEIGFTCA